MPRIGGSGSNTTTLTTSSTTVANKPVDSDNQGGTGGHGYNAPAWGSGKKGERPPIAPGQGNAPPPAGNQGPGAGQPGSTAPNTNLGAGMSQVRDTLKVRGSNLADVASNIPDITVNPNP